MKYEKRTERERRYEKRKKRRRNIRSQSKERGICAEKGCYEEYDKRRDGRGNIRRGRNGGDCGEQKT
jgi:hypothetical protein